jgi:hypothetical protein
MNDNQFIDNYFKNKNLNLIDPIISVMTKHLFDSSTVLKVLTSDEDRNDIKESYDEKLEKDIQNLGAKLLERLVDVNEMRKFVKQVKFIYFS